MKMTSKQFIEKLKWLVNNVPNVYYSGNNWSKLNKNGKWQFDCVVSIKSILWGFAADKTKNRGGTIYKSNGIADFTCNGALNYCTGVSKSFTTLVPGEYLCMKDTKYNHSGIYLGNGKVFECTTGWNMRKCMISDIDKNGIRSFKGKKGLRWTYHGCLKYVEYNHLDNTCNLIKKLQQCINEQWNCKLEVDGSFGPKTSQACSNHNLKKGINAKIMVKWLQEQLTILGYSVGRYGIDGSFGPDTLKAVKRFQKDHKLKIDGIVGINTYYALIS